MSAAVTARREPPGPQAKVSSRRLTERVFRIRESGIIVVLAMFVGVTAAIQPRFVGTQEIGFILANATVFALLALGETMVVISRNVDLSIGSVLGLSAYLSASLFGSHPGIPIPVVFLAGLGIGLACGAANGLMVSLGKVPSLVVTLATLYIIRGIDILIVGGNEVVAQTLPNAFIQGFELWNPANLGYLAAYAAVNFASKKITNAAGQSFTAGKLGKYTVGAGHAILLGPPFVFTKANINSFNF